MKNNSSTSLAPLSLATHRTLLTQKFHGFPDWDVVTAWEHNMNYWSKKLEANHSDATAVERVKHLLSVYLREIFRVATDNVKETERLALKVYDSAIRPRRGNSAINSPYRTLPLNQEIRGGLNHRTVLIKTMLQYLSLEIGTSETLNLFLGDGIFNEAKSGQAPTLFPRQFADNFKWLLGHSVKPGEFTDPLLPKMTPTFTDLLENSNVFTMGHFRNPFCRGGKHYYSNTSIQTEFSNNGIQKRMTLDEAIDFIKDQTGMKNTNITDQTEFAFIK